MRKKSEVKADITKLWEEHHAKVRVLEQELKDIVKYNQGICPHPEDKIAIRNNSYGDTGMGACHVEWKEKYCKKCGKILAKSHDETITKWIEVE